MFNFSIPLNVRWIECEPEGEKCECCDEPIFLKAWRAILCTQDGEQVGQSEAQICDGCAYGIGVNRDS